VAIGSIAPYGRSGEEPTSMGGSRSDFFLLLNADSTRQYFVGFMYDVPVLMAICERYIELIFKTFFC